MARTDRDASMFHLYSNCIPVRGARRSTICDLQRGTYHLMPNALYHILCSFRNCTIGAIKDAHKRRHDSVIDEYFSVLLSRDVGVLSDETDASFPPLDLSWDDPALITNAIIEIDPDLEDAFAIVHTAVEQLQALRCSALEVRSYKVIQSPLLLDIVDALNDHGLRHVELLLRFSEAQDELFLRGLTQRNQAISQIWIHSAPGSVRFPPDDRRVRVAFYRSPVTSQGCCGQVHPAYFSSHLRHFAESLRYNNCLNRKIAVSADGQIRNCPSMDSSFGDIRDTSLFEVVQRSEFRALWSMSKDEIDVCRDCEFRYICTDCRVHRTRPDDLRSKPAKCTYDPYRAVWSAGG